MLLLDALEHAPELLVVLTAREFLDVKDCRAHLTQLHKAAGRRWTGIQWARLVEFQRRGALHLNLLVKGVPADQADELLEVLARVWCSRVDATPAAQSVTPVYEAGGAVRYVSQHFMKPAQAPPLGWRGQRYSATRGYLVRPASVMRVEARKSLQLKRELWKLDRAGVPAADALELAEMSRDLAAGATFDVVRVLAETASEKATADKRARSARAPFTRRARTAA